MFLEYVDSPLPSSALAYASFPSSLGASFLSVSLLFLECPVFLANPASSEGSFTHFLLCTGSQVTPLSWEPQAPLPGLLQVQMAIELQGMASALWAPDLTCGVSLFSAEMS